jgi:hypothetical protein
VNCLYEVIEKTESASNYNDLTAKSAHRRCIKVMRKRVTVASW